MAYPLNVVEEKFCGCAALAGDKKELVCRGVPENRPAALAVAPIDLAGIEYSMLSTRARLLLVSSCPLKERIQHIRSYVNKHSLIDSHAVIRDQCQLNNHSKIQLINHHTNQWPKCKTASGCSFAPRGCRTTLIINVTPGVEL